LALEDVRQRGPEQRMVVVGNDDPRRLLRHFGIA
jgi:hypothetical protein